MWTVVSSFRRRRVVALACIAGLSLRWDKKLRKTEKKGLGSEDGEKNYPHRRS